MNIRQPFKILFLCEGNTCRSQMAEGLMRATGNDQIEVYSAGLNVMESKISPRAITVMKEIGIDISGHKPKTLDSLGPVFFDNVIFLCKNVDKDNLFLAGIPSFLDWPVPDPMESDTPHNTEETILNQYRDARNSIKDYIRSFSDNGHLEAQINSKKYTDTLFDTLEDGIIIHDNKRRIYFFNRAAETLTGFLRNEIIGRDCHTVFKPNGICSSLCTFCHANTDMISSPSEISDTNLKSYETDFTTKDGEDRKFKISLSPVYLGPGKATGVIATIRNITEISAMRWKLEEKHSFHGMVGRSTRMQDIFEIIRQTSSTNYPVLISGESGTGKELTAMAIHHESSRKGAPFMPINCGALPENILESELFGHVRGAFTGAIRDKKGRFELADKGTLFLDEIGELSPAFQVKLLRVLQEKRFERVGGEKTISVDVRIIAATNRDLQKMINDNTFREDLFYRLSVIPINLPPLRNRHEDLPGIVDQILKEIGSETGRQSMKISNEAMDVLLSYSWPGNIRQLINALQFASIRTGENYLLPEHLPPEIRGSVADLYQNHFINDGGSRIKLTRKSVKKALFETSGNKVNAAKLLGVGRATLYRFLDKNPL